MDTDILTRSSGDELNIGFKSGDLNQQALGIWQYKRNQWIICNHSPRGFRSNVAASKEVEKHRGQKFREARNFAGVEQAGVYIRFKSEDYSQRVYGFGMIRRLGPTEHIGRN